jgi:tripartite-type tricarboxylate transporter receptor subunit TctC
MKHYFLLHPSAFMLCCVLIAPASAQQYPSRPIRMVVAFAAGGAPDLVGRIVGQKLNEDLGQPVIVDNRAGATGNVGAEIVAKANPDGYTLFMATLSVAISPAFYKSLAFDPVRSFAPVGMVASVPLTLVVHPSLPAKNVRELIEVARSRPGALNYASVGNGSPQHLSAELFKSTAGVTLVHVPYKGGAQMITALLSGESHLSFAGLPPALPHVKAGRLRALAVSTAKRSASAPDVPTVMEAGLAGFEADNWNALLAPAGTPAAISERLNRQLERILGDADVRARLVQTGAEAAWGTPQALAQRMKSETEKWTRVARQAGVKPE